jgi:hypothetical protein
MSMSRRGDACLAEPHRRTRGVVDDVVPIIGDFSGVKHDNISFLRVEHQQIAPERLPFFIVGIHAVAKHSISVEITRKPKGWLWG